MKPGEEAGGLEASRPGGQKARSLGGQKDRMSGGQKDRMSGGQENRLIYDKKKLNATILLRKCSLPSWPHLPTCVKLIVDIVQWMNVLSKGAVRYNKCPWLEVVADEELHLVKDSPPALCHNALVTYLFISPIMPQVHLNAINITILE
jgi:hypothetical protein